MDGPSRGDIHAPAVRLLGRALEDPGVLDRLRAASLVPVDLQRGDLQAGYALLCHLDELGRLKLPHSESSAARSGAATANLRAISDWTIERVRERQRRRRASFDEGKPLRYHDDVPTPDELLLDTAARLNVVWWFNLWEQAWPPAPPIPYDIAAIQRERAMQALIALGVRLCQRGSARTAEPAEIAHDVLYRLDRIDPTAISRYLDRADRVRRQAMRQHLQGRIAGR